MTFEYWTSTSKSMSDIDDVLSMTDSDAGYMMDYLDDIYHFDTNGTDTYVSRVTTFFTPPHDGEYMFQLKADDGAKLFLDGVKTNSFPNIYYKSGLLSQLLIYFGSLYCTQY